MKIYQTYDQIKREHPYSKENPNKAYDVFTDYVMNKISLEERREIRRNWNNLQEDIISWDDYLLKQVNNI